MSQGVYKVLQAMWRKPYYKTVGLFPPSFDLSWIPDANTLTFTQPYETPDGVITTFNWDTTPKCVMYNGQMLFPDEGYDSGDHSATFAIAPEVGAAIWAIL